MPKQKRTRDEAFDVSMQALDLAQDLSCEALLVNPEYLKRRYRWFANKTLLRHAVERQRRIEAYVKLAYELQATISEWANEYPLAEDKSCGFPCKCDNESCENGY